MAIAIVYELPGMNQQQYDQLMHEAFQDKLGPGVISHTAGPVDGGWWAMDVFESQEAADNVGAKVMPGLAKMGMTEPPKLTIHQVHNVLVKS